MILFTSGFPYSGKTEFAKRLADKMRGYYVAPMIIHIDPKQYYIDEYKQMSKEEQSAVGIAAWEMALERVSQCICKLPNKALVIFDTCCNKSSYMKPLFEKSRSKGHHVFYVYVNSNLDDRKLRANGIDIDLNELESKYALGFADTIPKLKPLADKFFIVNNSDDGFSGLDESIDKIVAEIESIRTCNV